MLESFDSLIAWLAQHPEWLGWAIFAMASKSGVSSFGFPTVSA